MCREFVFFCIFRNTLIVARDSSIFPVQLGLYKLDIYKILYYICTEQTLQCRYKTFLLSAREPYDTAVHVTLTPNGIVCFSVCFYLIFIARSFPLFRNKFFFCQIRSSRYGVEIGHGHVIGLSRHSDDAIKLEGGIWCESFLLYFRCSLSASQCFIYLIQISLMKNRAINNNKGENANDLEKCYKLMPGEGNGKRNEDAARQRRR